MWSKMVDFLSSFFLFLRIHASSIGRRQPTHGLNRQAFTAWLLLTLPRLCLSSHVSAVKVMMSHQKTKWIQVRKKLMKMLFFLVLTPHHAAQTVINRSPLNSQFLTKLRTFTTNQQHDWVAHFPQKPLKIDPFSVAEKRQNKHLTSRNDLHLHLCISHLKASGASAASYKESSAMRHAAVSQDDTVGSNRSLSCKRQFCRDSFA